MRTREAGSGSVRLSGESWAQGWGLGQARSPLSPGQQTLSHGPHGEDFRACGRGHMVCVSASLPCLQNKGHGTTDRGHRAQSNRARPQAPCADS